MCKPDKAETVGYLPRFSQDSTAAGQPPRSNASSISKLYGRAIRCITIAHCAHIWNSWDGLDQLDNPITNFLVALCVPKLPSRSHLTRAFEPFTLKIYLPTPIQRGWHQKPDQARGKSDQLKLELLLNSYCSILLISPSNEILLLHRVRTSSSFPSAHVFPGGNLSASQDGEIPPIGDPRRHVDGPSYRIGAIRECFEESGILLAKRNDGSGAILEVAEGVREQARKDIHAGQLKFVDWVESQGGIIDTGMSRVSTRAKRHTIWLYIQSLYCHLLDGLPQQICPNDLRHRCTSISSL